MVKESMIGFLYKRCIDDQDYVQCKICRKRIRHRARSTNLEAHISIHSRDMKLGGPLPKIRYFKKAFQSLLVRSTMSIFEPRPSPEPSLTQMMPLMLALRQASERSDAYTDKFKKHPTEDKLNKIKVTTSTPLHSGIGPMMTSRLKRHVTSIKNKQCKLFFLMWHQVTLRAQLDYKREDDIIIGFDDLEETHSKMADHALVFMIRNITGKKKQPVAFYFIKSTLECSKLVSCVKEVYTALSSAGLNIIATISDHRAINIAAVKVLHCGDAAKDTYEIKAGKKVIHLYDPPHLLKGVRNHFIEKDIQYDGNDNGEESIATWAHIRDTYEYYNNKSRNEDVWRGSLSILRGINGTFIYKKVLNKNKVSTCSKVFGRLLGLGIHMIAGSEHTNLLPKEATQTGELLLFFYRLFDSVNGHYLTLKSCDGDDRRIILTKKSYHHDFWTEAISKLKSMRFISRDRTKTSTVPSLNCWIKTIQSFQTLWRTLLASGVKFFRTRVANIDPLENLFSAIQFKSKTSKPSPAQFMASYNRLLVRNVLSHYSIHNNCEPDSGKALLDLSDLKKTGSDRSIIRKKIRPRPGCEAKGILSSLVARQSCSSCSDCISGTALKVNETRYRKVAIQVQKILQTMTHMSNNGKKHIKEDLNFLIRGKINFKFPCTDHAMKMSNNFLDIAVVMHIHRFCKNANRLANEKITYKGEKLVFFRRLCDQYKNRYKSLKV